MDNNKIVLCAGIELGGTNCQVAIGHIEYESQNIKEVKIKDQITFSTSTDPDQTVTMILDWLKDKEFKQLGIASFGPLDIIKQSPTYGSITSTPKLPYAQYPIGPKISEALNLKEYGFDTDVNACAKAEFKIGDHKTQSSLAYITVGTGVGVGLIINGKCVHGLVHPEGGHTRVSKLPYDLDFKGVCAYHGDCLEGLCTNVSIAKRLNCEVKDLPSVSDDHPVWEAVGFYLADLCLNLTLLTSVETIIIGGGVLNRKILYPIIRKQFKLALNNYVQHPMLDDLDNYIKPPSLKSDVGLIGAFLLDL